MRKAPPIPPEQDSINFAVHPFSLPNQRLAKEKAEIYFEEQLRDRQGNLAFDKNNNPIISKWRIFATAEEGEERALPYGDDQKTLVVSGYLVLKNGDLDTGDFYFSSANFLRLVGRDPQDGRSYEWLRNSFIRLRRAVLRAEYVFYDPEVGEFISVLKDSNLISYVELYSLVDRRRYLRRQPSLPMNRATLGKPLVHDLKNNLSVTFDLDFFRSLKYPLSDSIYRFFNANLERIQDNNCQFRQELFCWANRLGISSIQYPSYIQRVLKNAHQELKEKGYLQADPVIEKDIGGYYYITYILSKNARRRLIDPNFYSPLTRELVTRGVNLTTCLRLLKERPESYIRQKIEYFDFERKRRGESIRSAWLVKAIEEDYTPPEGFVSKAEQEERERKAEEHRRQRAQAEAERRAEINKKNEERKRRAEESPYKPIWDQVTEQVAAKITRQSFLFWISPLFISRIDGNLVTIDCPSKFIADWVEEYYLEMLREVLSQVQSRDVKIRLTCEETEDDKKKQNNEGKA